MGGGTMRRNNSSSNNNNYYNSSSSSSKNKNRLSSTTCGEELQKIYKDGKSFKGFVKNNQKNHRFQAICVFDLF